MYYIALCDDSRLDRQTLMSHLGELQSAGYHMEVMAFPDGIELVRTHQKGRRFDLIVLDMRMEPLNGIETARQVRLFDTAVPILIVTATDEFATDGYQVGAWRYLLKPVDRDAFLAEVRLLLDQAGRATPQYFTLNNRRGVMKIRMDDIRYFESDVRTIRVHTVDAVHSFTGRIGQVAEQLAPFGFVRTHKSYVVNLRHVRGIFKGVLTLENGEELFMSKHRSKEVYQRFLDYAEAL